MITKQNDSDTKCFFETIVRSVLYNEEDMD